MITVREIRIGKAKELQNSHFDVDCSVTLLQCRGGTEVVNILFETGGSWKGDELLETIGKDRIDYVFCSHGHSDHIGCLSLFKESKLQSVGRDINDMKGEYIPAIMLARDKSIGTTLLLLRNGCLESLFHDRLELSRSMVKQDESIIRLVTTPGHTGHCVSLLLECNSGMKYVSLNNTEKLVKKVAIVGDLFESENDEKIWRLLSEQPELQEKSRKYVLEWCPDVIIPGHGPAFSPNKP
jgi:glyoxylase-like metal-dependent hydrolase (beta-lactamase superfamily II)